jgi:hypothetical protein
MGAGLVLPQEIFAISWERREGRQDAVEGVRLQGRQLMAEMGRMRESAVVIERRLSFILNFEVMEVLFFDGGVEWRV